MRPLFQTSSAVLLIFVLGGCGQGSATTGSSSTLSSTGGSSTSTGTTGASTAGNTSGSLSTSASAASSGSSASSGTAASTGSTTGGCPAKGSSANDGCADVALGETVCAPSNDVLTCSKVSDCQQWAETSDCSANALTCQAPDGGPAACACPANTIDAGSTFYVDPVAGSDHSSANPTGVESPAVCRFATLGHALGVARTGDTVLATGYPGSDAGPVVFATEVFPLAVPAGINLSTTDAPLTPADYVIQVHQDGGAGCLQLAAGATLSGFTVLADGGVSSTAAISAAAATLTDVSVIAGQAPPAASGVVFESGASSLNTVSVQGFDGGPGVQVRSGATLDATSLFCNFNGTGVDVLGTLTGTEVTVQNSTDDGVDVGLHLQDGGSIAGTLTLVDPAIGKNGARGIASWASATTVSGIGTIDRNGSTGLSPGIEADLGSLTMTADRDAGELDVAYNAAAGIRLVGTAASLTDLVVLDNGHGFDAGGGIEVHANAYGTSPATAVDGCNLSDNLGDGISVYSSPPDDGGAASFSATSNSITRNAVAGINLIASAGSVSADLETNSIAVNVGAGISVAQGPGNVTTEIIHANRVYSNGTGKVREAGVQFLTASKLSELTSNVIYGNSGDQLLFAAAAPTDAGWNLAGTSACSAANTFYCYAVDAGYVGVAATYASGAAVNAAYEKWGNSPPSGGVDYSATLVNGAAASYCAFTPPACP